eukprot:Awhi_evm1s2681
MSNSIGLMALVVRDYDETIRFYVDKVGFTLVEDTDLGEKRWVVIKPKSKQSDENDLSTTTGLLVAKAKNASEEAAVGNQTGGRCFLFLNTDDFWRDYKSMKEKGVTFLEEPRDEIYATVAVWQDLYGNKWDLIQNK